VAGVPDDGVLGRREHAVQRDGELHDSEVRAEMTARRRDARDEEPPDLGHERAELEGLMSRRHSGVMVLVSTDSAGTVMTLMSISACS